MPENIYRHFRADFFMVEKLSVALVVKFEAVGLSYIVKQERKPYVRVGH